MEPATIGYLFVGACSVYALVALWKGDALLGLGLLAVATLIYWVMVLQMRTDWIA